MFRKLFRLLEKMEVSRVSNYYRTLLAKDCSFRVIVIWDGKLQETSTEHDMLLSSIPSNSFISLSSLSLIP